MKKGEFAGFFGGWYHQRWLDPD